MFRLFFFSLVFVVFSVSFAQQVPQPFGLKLGISTKEDVLNMVKSEGGKVVGSGYRVIKGDIVNPNIEGIEVEKLPVDNLSTATFWFYQKKLFKIDYSFPLSMNKEEFYILSQLLQTKYGKPSRFIKPYLSDGVAEWNFGDIKVKLVAPWVSWNMYLIYEDTQLSRLANQSDTQVLQIETSKPKRGL